MNDDIQIIYVLTNPAMPGLVKIGITGQADVEQRMKQLYSTGVPVPFDCNYARKVNNAAETERSLHFGFGDSRLNPNREFFRISPERVIAVLKLIPGEDVTKTISEGIKSETAPEDRESGDRLKARRPNLNFVHIGIPLGSILKFRDGKEEVTVVGERQVEYHGENSSLTATTRKILGKPDGYPIQPSPYWTFDGRQLNEIYEDYHGEDDAAA